MKLAIITYQVNHLKTESVINNLQLLGRDEVHVYALPFKIRKVREVLFNHRPDMSVGLHPKFLCEWFDIPYKEINCVSEVHDNYDYVLVGGAGILPGEFVEKYKVINVHPGLIPSVRGLDSFKWAIYHNRPLGNSLHFIDAEVDKGQHIKSFQTPINSNDTIETLAKRHYEIEIAMLSNFREYVSKPEHTLENLHECPATMRMPIDIEKELLLKSETYIKSRGAMA